MRDTFRAMRLRIEELRKAKGWSRYQLAQAMQEKGVSQQAVYRLARNNGRAVNFNARMLDAFCDVLGVEPTDLLQRERPHRR